MDRRTFIVAGIASLTAALAAEAQYVGKGSKTLGVLTLVRGDSPGPTQGFFQGLKDLGWVEGKNLTIERRAAEGHEERLPDLALELVRLNVDVILAAGGPATLNAARHATKTIPIVMVASARDPVGDGLIQSYARPGGNVTGIVTAPDEITGKQLELLKTLTAGASRVGVLWDSTTGRAFRLSDETYRAARALGVELLGFEVRGPSEFAGAIAAAAGQRVGGMLFAGSPMFVQNRQEIADLLIKNRLPAISVWRSFADAGVLLAYGPSLSELFRRAATYVHKILGGMNPADIPVEQPAKFELVINLKTAKDLGLTLPPSLLARADQVIE